MPRKTKKSGVETLAVHDHVASGVKLFCRIYEGPLHILERCKECGELYPRSPTTDERIWYSQAEKMEVMD